MATANWQRTADSKAIAIDGELNRDSVPQLWQQRRQWLAGSDALTLDLAKVSKVDSAGVAMLLQAKRVLQREQRQLIISQPSDQLQAIIAVSGVTDILAIK